MANPIDGIPLNRLDNHPALSLTHVQWVTEIEDSGESILEVPMFDVVGEQYRLESVMAAAASIAEEGTFQPARFWLMPDDHNEHDAQAVAVYATAQGRAYHVGFLSRGYASRFRESMRSLGRAGQSLEVLGCITAGKSSPHPNARLYLPVEFAKEIQNGYADDPSNHPAWLRDTTPVPKRPPSRRAQGFTMIELCKIYCKYAKQKLWFNFPGEVEGRINGYLSSGLGSLGEVVPHYYDDDDPVPMPRSVAVNPLTSRPNASPAADASGRHGITANIPKHIESAKALARAADLTDLFESWDEWIASVKAEASLSRSPDLLRLALDQGELAFAERYRELLREEMDQAQVLFFETVSEPAQAKVFPRLVSRVKKATPLGKSNRIDHEFEAFKTECEEWNDLI